MKLIQYEKLSLKDSLDLRERFVTWVNKVWSESRGTELASFKQASEEFNMNLKDIESMVNDCGLIYNVAIGNGSGFGNIPKREWTIEPSDDTFQKFFINLYGG